MNLPVTRSGIDKSWNSQKFLMIGHSGVGKSTFWSFAKNPLYIMTEKGLNFLDVCKIECKCYADVMNVIDELLKRYEQCKAANKEFPYDLIVLDTADKFVDMAYQATLEWADARYPKKGSHETIQDIADGTLGWSIRQSLVVRLMNELDKLPIAKAVIAHDEIKTIKEKGVQDYQKTTISIGGKVGGDFLAWADHTLLVIGKMNGENLVRTVYTQPSQSRDCKSRGGVIKNGWQWSNNDEENFKKLREQFN